MQGIGGIENRQEAEAQRPGFNNRTLKNLYGFLERGRGGSEIKKASKAQRAGFRNRTQ